MQGKKSGSFSKAEVIQEMTKGKREKKSFFSFLSPKGSPSAGAAADDGSGLKSPTQVTLISGLRSTTLVTLISGLKSTTQVTLISGLKSPTQVKSHLVLSPLALSLALR